MAELEGVLARAVERTVLKTEILLSDGRDLDHLKGRPRSAVGRFPGLHHGTRESSSSRVYK